MSVEETARPTFPGEREFALKAPFLLISLAVLVLDQWSKWLIEAHLPLHASHPVIGGLLNIVNVRNTGVAFGLFAGRGSTWVLAAVGFLALVLVAVYFLLGQGRHRLLLASLALIMGGAVGNLLDRLVSGAVTDFIDVYVGTHHWPSFNVADSAISVGIALMALDAFRARDERSGG